MRIRCGLMLAGVIVSGVVFGSGCARATRMQAVPIDGLKLSQEHPTVVEAAVVAGHVEGLTKAKAFVVRGTSSAPVAALAEELQVFCRERLHRYQVPQLFEFVDALPKTATGKIQRFKLRDG